MDPYFTFKQDIEGSLQSASNLHSSYRRILATVPISSQATSDELSWSKEELNGVLITLEGDLEELQSTVDTVSRDPSRFGLDDAEVRQRQAFVKRVKDELGAMRRSMGQAPASNYTGGSRQTASAARYGNSSPAYPPSPREDEDDIPSTYEGQQQQFLYETQDRLLDGIGGTVSTLRQQASLMGREVLDQVGLLNDLESGVDRSQSRLERANKKLNNFIQQNKNSASSWTIFLLTIVLSFLLLAIILV